MQKADVAHQLMMREIGMVSYYDTVSWHAKQETLLAKKSCSHIYLEILQNIKYDTIMILQYDTMHYKDDII
jgi:hypothetical protein